MSKTMLIDSAHMEEVRVALVDGDKLDRFDFEAKSKNRIRGNIYLAKVIRVEPALQAAFVDYGGGRHGFLGFSEIHHSYFQIPVADRQELEDHIQNAMAAREEATDGESSEEMDAREISKLRYQFYKRYKIQEVIKKRQIMLVQVTKEERGNKGASLTTYISLVGRYCVLMPNTVKGSGVSRKINNPTDRKKLKKIVSTLNIENGSTVIRTAGVGHTKAEIKKDFDYLVKSWDEIRKTTLESTAPCLIHEEANVIKRALRDMYSRDIDSVFIEGEVGYKIAKDFVKKLMPSHAKKVKLYNDEALPLFGKFKINEQINQIYSTRVDLPSGGYLIINNTEALIAVDVNSGGAIHERNIAGTALKTNLEAAVELARQCRLRDLGGLIVVDFIDMTDRHDNIKVERCLKHELKDDKAKIQVGPISGFGLLEFSRQRLRSSIADANMVICPHCHGTGFIWTEESNAIQILRHVEEACALMNASRVRLTLPTAAALYIINSKRSFISSIEERNNMKILFDIDPTISATDFKLTPIQGANSANDVGDMDPEEVENSDETNDQEKTKERAATGNNVNNGSNSKGKPQFGNNTPSKETKGRNSSKGSNKNTKKEKAPVLTPMENNVKNDTKSRQPVAEMPTENQNIDAQTEKNDAPEDSAKANSFQTRFFRNNRTRRVRALKAKKRATQDQELTQTPEADKVTPKAEVKEFPLKNKEKSKKSKTSSSAYTDTKSDANASTDANADDVEQKDENNQPPFGVSNAEIQSLVSQLPRIDEDVIKMFEEYQGRGQEFQPPKEKSAAKKKTRWLYNLLKKE